MKFSCIKTFYLSPDMKKSNAFDEKLFKRNTHKVVSHPSHWWRLLTQIWQRCGRIEVCKITCVQTTLWHLDCLLSLPGNRCQGHRTRSAWVSAHHSPCAQSSRWSLHWDNLCTTYMQHAEHVYGHIRNHLDSSASRPTLTQDIIDVSTFQNILNQSVFCMNTFHIV